MDQTDETQANPVKKRRRWLIVTGVLVLLSSVAWWYYPRGDARFVGKWNVEVGEFNSKQYGIVRLRKNGIAQCDWPLTPSMTSWRVHEDNLNFGPDYADGSLLDGLNQAFGSIPVLQRVWTEIESVTSGEIRVRSTRGYLILTRIE